MLKCDNLKKSPRSLNGFFPKKVQYTGHQLPTHRKQNIGYAYIQHDLNVVKRETIRNVCGRDDTIYCPTSRSTFDFIVVGEPKRILGLTPALQITILGGTYLVPHYIPKPCRYMSPHVKDKGQISKKNII